ncbi:hypothetical protein HU200_035027 [Digitaria exilis]|uniref:Uncharacterized protein n=1 Tax=Digitaria exilis TaxID=1010633 RepID=A0A835BSW8_9POAL|nr:hypothetical protein HU200_035027 [Digitaria exilis]
MTPLRSKSRTHCITPPPMLRRRHRSNPPGAAGPGSDTVPTTPLTSLAILEGNPRREPRRVDPDAVLNCHEKNITSSRQPLPCRQPELEGAIPTHIVRGMGSIVHLAASAPRTHVLSRPPPYAYKRGREARATGRVSAAQGLRSSSPSPTLLVTPYYEQHETGAPHHCWTYGPVAGTRIKTPVSPPAIGATSARQERCRIADLSEHRSLQNLGVHVCFASPPPPPTCLASQPRFSPPPPPPPGGATMTSTPDINRQPCPDRILEDAGSAFAMGAVGGSIYHFAKGLYNSPNGHRLAGGGAAIRMSAPRVGGGFAVWGGLFSTFDCAMVYACSKEDPWNSIAAGAAAGGLLSLRHGLLATGRSAVMGAALLALIEGAGIMINRVLADPPPAMDYLFQQPGGQVRPEDYYGQPHAPPEFLGVPAAPPVVVDEIPVVEPRPAGWLGGLFGRKQQQGYKIGGGDQQPGGVQPNNGGLEASNAPPISLHHPPPLVPLPGFPSPPSARPVPLDAEDCKKEEMATPETSREPCPDRILDDVGGAFGMGAVGGSLFHFLRGLYNSPKGHRLAGGATPARMLAPRLGGSFAVWGGLFSTFDCAFVYAREKEDPWNSIAAGAATGGFLAMRQGLLASGRSAIFGGALLALIEGAGIMLNRVVVPQPPEDPLQYPGQNPGMYAPPGFLGVPPTPPPQQSPIVVQEVPVADSGSTGWLGGLFGRKQKDKSEVLEMDLPPEAVPSFDYNDSIFIQKERRKPQPRPMGWRDRPSYIHLPGARRHFIDEVGRGFWGGIMYGSTCHFLRGLRHSPNGARAARANAPRVAGSWAAFFGLWCAFENAAFHARRRDDPWNAVAGCAAASAFVELRSGARVAARAGVAGAVFVSLIEGFSLFVDRLVAVKPAPAVEPPPPPPPPPPAVEVVPAPPPPAAVVEPVAEAVDVPAAAARPAATVDRLGRPLGYVEPPHVREPRGFRGIPPRYPYVVKEVPASRLGY